MELSQTKQEVLSFLESHMIDYEYHEHAQAHTIDECLRMPFLTPDITICKNIFLCNRQQTNYFLLLLRPSTPFRTSVVSKLLNTARLSFAPANMLEEKLHLTSGSLSPLGLLYDQHKEITLCYESAVKQTPKIAFHPCDNTATVIFEQNIFWEKVIPLLDIVPVSLDLPKTD